MRAYLIRHGQSEQNTLSLKHRISIEAFRTLLEQSHNSPLTAIGRQQAHRTAVELSSKSITHVYASPFLRAQQTASIIGEMLDIPITTVPTLHEILPLVPPVIRREGQRSLGSTYIRGYLHVLWPHTPLSGETLWMARQRIANTWASIAQGWQTNTNAVVVAHRAFIWMTLRYLEGNTPWMILRRNLNNAGISEIYLDVNRT